MTKIKAIFRCLAIIIPVCCFLSYKNEKKNEGWMFCLKSNGICKEKDRFKPCPDGTLDPCGNGSNKVYMLMVDSSCIEQPPGIRFCTK